MEKNLIILMIDGGRLDRALKSHIFNKIKEKSTFFSQSITYAPHTIAAMHAVFSGCYGTRTGTNSYWSTYEFKKNKFKTITEYLHEVGYYTCADVVSKLTIPEQGFDEINIHDELKDNLLIRHVDYLRKIKEKNDRGQNAFLYLQYSNIHTGIMEQVLKVYNNFSEEFFNNIKQNEDRYDLLFKNAENYLENMLKEITKLKLDDKSIILIMSDHGISVGEKIGERAYGAFCYDYTLRTFTYFVGSDFPIKEIQQQVRTVDFMPTILEILKIPLDVKYEKLDGVSLMPVIQGEIIPEKTAISETGNPQKEKAPPKKPNVKSIRTSKWKLILNEYNNTREFYDLQNDPKEEENITGEKLEEENTLWIELKNNIDITS
jgi:arylsulfatase A-like enzyme